MKRIKTLLWSLLFIIAAVHPCAADWTSKHFLAITNSPYCTSTRPNDIWPEYYKWPKNSPGDEPYHSNYEVYHKKKMFYCHGKTPDTEKIIYVWPSWKFGLHEDQLYPVAFVKTSAGVLAQRGRETLDSTLWLNGKPFIQGLSEATISQAYPEKNGDVNIVIAQLYSRSDNRFTGYSPDSNGYYLIDFSVSPPFISMRSLPPTKEETEKNSLQPLGAGYKIKKIDDNTYEFSGDWRVPDDINPSDRPAAKYIYDRKSGTIIRAQIYRR